MQAQGWGLFCSRRKHLGWLVARQVGFGSIGGSTVHYWGLHSWLEINSKSAAQLFLPVCRVESPLGAL